MNGASPVVAPGKALQRMRCRGSRRRLGLSCRPDEFDNQRVEAIIKCEVLNRMSSRGMPESVRIR